MSGSNRHYSEAAGATVSVTGSNDVFDMAGGGLVNLLSGKNDIVGMDGGAFTLAAGTSGSLVGSSDTVSASAHVSLAITGNSDNIVMANGDSVTLLAGTNDSVVLTAGTLTLKSAVVSVLLNGSNNVIKGTAGNQLNVNGSGNAIVMSAGGYVGLLGGADDVVNISGGTVDTLNNLFNVWVSGSNDDIGMGTASMLTVNGTNDLVAMGISSSLTLLTGEGDNLFMSSGTITLAAGVTNVVLSGSYDSLTAAGGATLNVAGSDDAIVMLSGGYVGLLGGVNDVVNISGGTVDTLNNLFNVWVTGSDDAIGMGTASMLTVNGSDNFVDMGASGTLRLLTGGSDSVYMSSGSITAAYGVTNVIVNGSNDAIATASGAVLNVDGSADVLTVGSYGYAGLLGGDGDVVKLTFGQLQLANGVTNATLDGSYDMVGMAQIDKFTLAGSGDVLSAAAGSTIALSAGDTGDVIDVSGGTILAPSGIGPIYLYGTGDIVSGAGAAAVQVNPNPVFRLAAEFTNQPSLSQVQIEAAEAIPNYQSDLDSFFSGANIYGSASSLPANTVAMLDGYSNLYLALIGVPAAAIAEDVYIEQQLAWAETTYPIPTDGLQGVMQTLMPALLDTNPATQPLVQEALSLLQQGQAAAAQGNQGPMLDDTTAKMLLEIAEQPDGAKLGPLGDEVYTPGRSGHWQVEVWTSGAFTFTYKSPPLIDQILTFVDTYVGPLIDVAAVLSGNYELELAASALSLVQAGQDFASGEDLQGAFSVLGAIGGGLQQVGGEATVIGKELSEAVGVGSGIEGITVAVEQGNVLAGLEAGLSSVGGLAGLGTLSGVQQFAAIGGALASTAEAVQSGNVLGAVSGLVDAAAADDVLPTIRADINALWIGYVAQISGQAASGASGSNIGTINPGYVTTLTTNGTESAITLYDPTLLTNTILVQGMAALMSDAAALVGLQAFTGGAPSFIVAAHGSPASLSSNSLGIGPSYNAQTVAAEILSQPGYKPGEAVTLLACSTAGEAGTIVSQSFAQQLANEVGATVYAASTPIYFAANGGFEINPIIVNNQPLASEPGPGIDAIDSNGSLNPFQPQYGHIPFAH